MAYNPLQLLTPLPLLHPLCLRRTSTRGGWLRCAWRLRARLWQTRLTRAKCGEFRPSCPFSSQRGRLSSALRTSTSTWKISSLRALPERSGARSVAAQSRIGEGLGARSVAAQRRIREGLGARSVAEENWGRFRSKVGGSAEEN